MYITLYCLASFLAVQKMYNKGTITTSTPPKQLKTRLALCFFCMESKAFKLWLQEWSLQTREPPRPHTLGRGSLDLFFRLQDHLAWNVCWEFHLKTFDGNSLRSLFFSELGPESRYRKHDCEICLATICYYCAYSKQPGSKSNSHPKAHFLCNLQLCLASQLAFAKPLSNTITFDSLTKEFRVHWNKYCFPSFV